VDVLPVRTPTLPPATHTNAWILGQGELWVVDPASPWEDEQGRLLAEVRRRLAGGERLGGLILTHHHPDHVSGAVALASALPKRPPIFAHHLTAALLGPQLPIDAFWEDDQQVALGGDAWRVLWTPGHAPGHLALLRESDGTVVAGDLVAGVGTIVLNPEEGDLGHYLASLQRLRDLGCKRLLPAHGPALDDADRVLEGYLKHRLARNQQILQALGAGPAPPQDLVRLVYPDLAPLLRPVAEAQLRTHLRWLGEQGQVAQGPTGLFSLR
jgi:glyoxylase-like metal-dependent hydrolase (beta-lactamase superfamily II)